MNRISHHMSERSQSTMEPYQPRHLTRTLSHSQRAHETKAGESGLDQWSLQCRGVPRVSDSALPGSSFHTHPP